MPDRAWLKTRLRSAVEQGMGVWNEDWIDNDLGTGIFMFRDSPGLGIYNAPLVVIFEHGLTYGGDERASGWKVRYDDILEAEYPLPRDVMVAQADRSQPVDMTLVTRERRLRLRLSLYWYGVLHDIVRQALKKREYR